MTRYGNILPEQNRPNIIDDPLPLIINLQSMYETNTEGERDLQVLLDNAESLLRPHTHTLEKITSFNDISYFYNSPSTSEHVFLDLLFNYTGIVHHTLQPQYAMQGIRLPAHKSITIPPRMKLDNVGWQSEGTIINHGTVDSLGFAGRGTYINYGDFIHFGKNAKDGLYINAHGEIPSAKLLHARVVEPARIVGEYAKNATFVNLTYATHVANGAENNLIVNYGWIEKTQQPLGFPPRNNVFLDYGTTMDDKSENGVSVIAHGKTHVKSQASNTVAIATNNTNLNHNFSMTGIALDTTTHWHFDGREFPFPGVHTNMMQFLALDEEISNSAKSWDLRDLARDEQIELVLEQDWDHVKNTILHWTTQLEEYLDEYRTLRQA